MVTLTAWQALFPHAGPLSGLRVLIHGAAGGVGHIAVQLAKLAGAEVIGTASANNRDFLLGLGAVDVVDYKKVPLEKAAKDVDVVLDTRGGEDYVRLLETLRPGGIIVSLLGRQAGANSPAATRKGLRAGFLSVQSDKNALARVGQLMADRALRVVIEQEFQLEEASAAHTAVEAGHGRGRVLIRPTE
jgi:NADPH:quinone reductase-like Zn-dependent oxidoreductase